MVVSGVVGGGVMDGVREMDSVGWSVLTLLETVLDDDVGWSTVVLEGWTTIGVDVDWTTIGVDVDWITTGVDVDWMTTEVDVDWTTTEVDVDWSITGVDVGWTVTLEEEPVVDITEDEGETKEEKKVAVVDSNILDEGISISEDGRDTVELVVIGTLGDGVENIPSSVTVGDMEGDKELEVIVTATVLELIWIGVWAEEEEESDGVIVDWALVRVQSPNDRVNQLIIIIFSPLLLGHTHRAGMIIATKQRWFSCIRRGALVRNKSEWTPE